LCFYLFIGCCSVGLGNWFDKVPKTKL
jgi:hypothetical protein